MRFNVNNILNGDIMMEALEKVLKEILGELKSINSKIDEQNLKASSQMEKIQSTLESIEGWEKIIYEEI